MRFFHLMLMLVAAMMMAALAAGCDGDSDGDDDPNTTTDAAATTADDAATVQDTDADAGADNVLIVIDESIGGVSLGAPKAEAIAVFGEADSSNSSNNQISGEQETRLTFDDSSAMVIVDSNDVISFVGTENADATTDQGVGVGSTADELQAAHDGITCVTDGDFPNCKTGGTSSAGLATIFDLNDDLTIKSVAVGYIID